MVEPDPLPEHALHVVGAVIVDPDRRCLAARRGPGLRHGGLWEFPGGKVEPGEAPRAALVREIAEELGVTIAVGELLGRGLVEIGGRQVALDCYVARITAGALAPTDHDELAWCEADELVRLTWAPADVPVLAAVRAWLLHPVG
jgi:8-oxo-dGTP diphosphatase